MEGGMGGRGELGEPQSTHRILDISYTLYRFVGSLTKLPLLLAIEKLSEISHSNNNYRLSIKIKTITVRDQ